MSAWDHVKMLENSCNSNKELTSYCERKFPKITYSGMFGQNRGCIRRGFMILGSSCSARRALSCHCYLVGVSSFFYLTS